MAKVSVLEIFLFSLLICNIHCEDPEQCIQDTFCSCHFEDNRKIDISELIPNRKDKPGTEFLEADKPNYRYFFSGCSDSKFKPIDYNIPLDNITITNKTEIEGSLILYESWLITNTTTNITTVSANLTVLARASQIHYHVLANEQEPYELIYKNKTDGNIIAAFRLICEKYEKPYIQIIDDPLSRQFTLNSPFACIVKVPEESSVGSKLLSIFLIICLVYFIGGGCILYFARGARGVELIPNIDFWRRLPGLVRDGTLFIFGGCNASYISSAEAYDRI